MIQNSQISLEKYSCYLTQASPKPGRRPITIIGGGAKQNKPLELKSQDNQNYLLRAQFSPMEVTLGGTVASTMNKSFFALF